MENGKYKTEHGSVVEISGKYSGVTRVDFDWFEEPDACVDCEVEPYPEEFDTNEWHLNWNCHVCGGGNAKLTKIETNEPDTMSKAAERFLRSKGLNGTLAEWLDEFASQQVEKAHKEQFEALQFMTELERTEYIEICLAERSLNKIS